MAAVNYIPIRLDTGSDISVVLTRQGFPLKFAEHIEFGKDPRSGLTSYPYAPWIIGRVGEEGEYKSDFEARSAKFTHGGNDLWFAEAWRKDMMATLMVVLGAGILCEMRLRRKRQS
jgi:hypothetical protein